ncbi:Pyrroline-5-carboxylate reductase [hydrothermal vent metagenome]|uniref:Pyrroline-5-carboxylate reductase n=1 Tax=hydrothermal vent metagenome TaxID=652676 RepID=A0A3B1E7V1_9ZZZZ
MTTGNMTTGNMTIGFIGAGRMATALAQGFISSGFTSVGHLMASDPFASACEQFHKATGAKTTDSNALLLQQSEIIILAVKPQVMSNVLKQLSANVTSKHLVISIAAGVSLQTISDLLENKPRLIRVMPNTPALVGCGASGFSLGTSATLEDAKRVQSMLSTVGVAVEVPETLLDAVTGLSGSGPAYVYQVIEALSDGGVQAGLPRDMATKLAAQTVMGAAKMVLETGEHPGALKDAVTSPGGTTIAGIHALEQGGLRSCLMNAVQAATKRSQELR